MLFHMSIAAADPQHVASVIAELWQGKSQPFPPVSDNAWVALAGDERGTLIEVYPQGTVLRESEGDVDAYGDPSGADRFSASHGAMRSGSSWPCTRTPAGAAPCAFADSQASSGSTSLLRAPDVAEASSPR